METRILEQQHIAILKLTNFRLRRFANTIVSKRNRLQQRRNMLSDRTQTVLINTLTFRSSQVRRKNHARALIDRVLNRRKRSCDARIVVTLAVFDRHVEVDAHKKPPATKLQILYRKFSHEKAQKAQKELKTFVRDVFDQVAK